MKKLYSIGEIFRGGMLLSYRGKAYTQKSVVAKVVRALKFKVIQTKWGPSKALPLSEIKKHNARYLPLPASKDK